MIKVTAIFLTFCLLSCNSSTESQNQNTTKLRVAVAASCQFAFKNIADSVMKKHDLEIEVITGSSGKITTQIMNGAPFDIFVSANMDYPKELINANKAIDTVYVYGYGIPVFWTLYDNFDLNNINEYLVSKSIKRMAIAEPRNAPYGEMAVRYLKAGNLYEQLEPKLVFGESISQVNEYVLNKTVDVGISAKSIVSSDKLKGKGSYKSLTKEYYIKQGMVVVNSNDNKKEKKLFIDFVLSKEGKDILTSFGYAVD